MSDPRVPVFATDPSDAAPGDVVLHDALAAGHAAGCRCCAPRPPLAMALNRLFLARVRGEGAVLRRVLVACAPGAEVQVKDAIGADPVSAARFRYAGRVIAPQKP